ncbi:MAG TPA: hypothetical protein PKB09_03260 [Candidatus Saccharibacteria bacterium]|nr:hypothetical protein [Candidatus Saccharibacteria bacterium]
MATTACGTHPPEGGLRQSSADSCSITTFASGNLVFIPEPETT